MNPIVLAVAFAVALAPTADAKTKRSSAVRNAFKVEHPCPATGKPKGSCPGFIIDHVVPLCAGGPDAVTNLQWQTVADAKRKDRLERAQCRQ